MAIILADAPTILTRLSPVRRILATIRPVPVTAAATKICNERRSRGRGEDASVAAKVDSPLQKHKVTPAAVEPKAYSQVCVTQNGVFPLRINSVYIPMRPELMAIKIPRVTATTEYRSIPSALSGRLLMIVARMSAGKWNNMMPKLRNPRESQAYIDRCGRMMR